MDMLRALCLSSHKVTSEILYANTYIWNLKKNKKGSEEPRGKTGIKTQTY